MKLTSHTSKIAVELSMKKPSEPITAMMKKVISHAPMSDEDELDDEPGSLGGGARRPRRRAR